MWWLSSLPFSVWPLPLDWEQNRPPGGLHSVFGVDNGLTTQLILIAVITTIAIISVMRGLDRGVKVLSNFNILVALLLLVFVISAGPTLSALSGIGENLSHYLTYFLPLSDWVGREDEVWYKSWTVFYWTWWISWSPFVGLFIARISRGRTIREFVTAVLLLPTLVSAIWMSVFGGIALDQIQLGIGELANGIDDPSLALFHMLGNLPFTTMASLVAVVLVLTFFITSADSGSLVIDIITAGGRLDTPRYQRAFWAHTAGPDCCGLAHRRRQRCPECVTGRHHHHGRAVYRGAAPFLPVPGTGPVVRVLLMGEIDRESIRSNSIDFRVHRGHSGFDMILHSRILE